MINLFNKIFKINKLEIDAYEAFKVAHDYYDKSKSPFEKIINLAEDHMELIKYDFLVKDFSSCMFDDVQAHEYIKSLKAETFKQRYVRDLLEETYNKKQKLVNTLSKIGEIQ